MSHMKKPYQILNVRLVGTYAYAINVDCSKHTFKLVKSLSTRIIVFVSKLSARRINEYYLAGLGVGKFNESHTRQRNLRSVANRDGDDIMSFVKQAKGLFEVG